MALYAAIGPEMFFEALVPIAFVVFLLLVGIVAHNNEKPAPYWSCIGSIVIYFSFLLPLLSLGPKLLSFGPNETGVIFFACAFSIGGYMSYSAIRHGHWATRTLGLLVMTFYTIGFYAIAQNSIHSWDHVFNHWFK